MQLTKISFDLTGAKCLDEDPEIFFVDNPDDEDYDQDKTNRALRSCSVCPVIADCLQFAMAEKAVGVWGGTTTTDRRIILNRVSRGKSLVDKRKGNRPENLFGMNDKRRLEKGAMMVKKLVKAVEADDGWASEVTLMLAKMKIGNPEMSYAEMSAVTGLTRSQVSNNLQRFVRRIDERVF